MPDVKDLTKNALQTASKASPAKNGAMSKPAGLAAAGIAMAALPVVVEKVSNKLGGKVGEKVSDLGDQAKDKAKGQLKDTAKEMAPDLKDKVPGAGGLSKLFGGGGDDDGEGGAGDGTAASGHGSGRRMPIQQSVDVAVPIKVAYDQWTRFEDWPDFMHRLESVEQSDDSTVVFEAKIWGIKRRFTADILEQRPEERIEWDVSEGLSHTGVVTFHKLAPRLTHVEVTLDVDPSGFFEKVARGARFIKRAVRGDLHRFKAYVELNEDSDRGWRGTIKDGDVKSKTERKSRSNGSRSRSRGSSSSNGRKRSSSSRSKSSTSSRSKSRSSSKS